MRFVSRVGLIVGCCWCLLLSSAEAQNWRLTSEAYAQGVHAYFAGNCLRAEHYLTMAIGAGTDDPRPYYFRALARLRLGRLYEAQEDMEIGAELEAQNPGRFGVGRALQRVQGANRLTLECYRREAKIAHSLNQQALNQSRQQQQSSSDDANQRRRVQVPLDRLLGTPQAADFQQESAPQPPAMIPPQPTFTPLETPSDADQAPAVAPDDAATDPFADDPVADTPVETEEPAPADTDPFLDEPEDDDPFGGF